MLIFFFFFNAIGVEVGGEKKVSSETVSSGKQRKCQDKKSLSMNAVLSLYCKRRVVSDISL